MNVGRGLVEGVQEILSHKFRSLLTVSGVVLGVASLMAMFAVVEGMTAGMRFYLNKFGGVERVGIDRVEIPPEQESMKDLSRGRTYRDVEALRRQATLVAVVSPEKRLNRVITLSCGNRQTQVFGLRGVEDEYLQVDTWNEMAAGRFVADLDNEFRNRVIILGADHARDLFPQGGALGSKILVDGMDFIVVGLLRESPFRHINGRSFIPLSTMMDLFFGVKLVGGVDQGADPTLDQINIRVRDFRYFAPALEQMRTVLEATHRGVQDFGFQTREDWFDAIESQVLGARLSGGMVAGVCLMAGAVGITNIMLASIRERTREIGVRRAIGARPADIFVQITIEVFLLALLGGVLGVVAGWILVHVIKEIATTENAPLLRAGHVWASLLAGVAVGLLGGFIPAVRAARMNPIEALRYE
ncbi:MAG: ABC transporter permease [Candidatus Methylacidiphilales bacterium]|nr:ABC transporter permease [Candidatus Methylacidiphilales bacterium]